VAGCAATRFRDDQHTRLRKALIVAAHANFLRFAHPGEVWSSMRLATPALTPHELARLLWRQQLPERDAATAVQHIAGLHAVLTAPAAATTATATATSREAEQEEEPQEHSVGSRRSARARAGSPEGGTCCE
jgi:hypothetical protein